jgi:hypothetical protein
MAKQKKQTKFVVWGTPGQGGAARDDTQKLADKFHQAITICRGKT